MAEEQVTKQAPATPAPAVSEPVVEPAAPVEPTYTTTEQEAISQGWKPKDKWDGNPEDHRSAREYLDRGELLNKIKSQSSELRQVQAIVAQLTNQNKQVYQAGYERALKELREAKAKAITNGDGTAVAQIEERIDQTKELLDKVKAAPVQQVGPNITPAFQRFQEENPWYGKDQVLRKWAHGEAIDFAKEHKGATEQDVYDHIKANVRKAFPEKFNRAGPPNPDGEGRVSSSPTRTTGSGSFEKLLGTLPEDQAKVAKEMVKRGIITKEKYVEDYEAIGRNR